MCVCACVRARVCLQVGMVLFDTSVTCLDVLSQNLPERTSEKQREYQSDIVADNRIVKGCGNVNR